MGESLPKKLLVKFLKDMSNDYAFSITTVVIILLVIVLVAVYLGYPAASAHKGTSPSSLPKFEFTQYSVLKNLTYIDLYSFSTHKLVTQVPVISVSSINASLSSTSASPGKKMRVAIVYNGTFSFNNYNVSAFLNKTVNIYYYGYYSNGSDTMYVPGSEPNSTKYFTSVGNSNIITPPGASPSSEMELVLNITPTQNATGKDWNICGGVFIAFKNDSSWVSSFTNLTYHRIDVSNSTVFNKISKSCAEVKVA